MSGAWAWVIGIVRLLLLLLLLCVWAERLGLARARHGRVVRLPKAPK